MPMAGSPSSSSSSSGGQGMLQGRPLAPLRLGPQAMPTQAMAPLGSSSSSAPQGREGVQQVGF